MKKYSVFILALLFALGVKSQFSNGDFETWNQISFEMPVGYETSTWSSVILSGVSNVTKIEGYSGSAVKMITIPNEANPFAYISNGKDDPSTGKGGVPYTQKPTQMTFMAKYDVQPNDTAIAVAMFKFNGSIIGVGEKRMTGTNTEWHLETMPLMLFANPDSVIIAFSSSNALNGYGIAEGSWLAVDSLAFNTTNPIPYGNFDTWSTVSTEIPDGAWLGEPNILLAAIENLPVYEKTADAYEGDWALKFTVRQPSMYWDEPIGNFSNGYYDFNSEQTSEGGIAFSSQKGTFEGYYKFIPVGVDTANVYLLFLKNGSPIFSIDSMLPPTADYQKFQISFDLPQAPDSVFISFAASLIHPATINNVLYLDALQFNELSVGDVNLQQELVKIAVVQNKIKILSADNGTISLFDVAGKNVLDKNIMQGETEVLISSNLKGIYLLKIQVNNETIVRKIVF